jgi:hypothetical protein
MHLISIIFPILAFLFEAYPRFLNRKFGVDVWTHLLYLQEYHKQGGVPKKIENGFLVPGIYDYPPAFIYILAKFPFRLVERYEFLFSPFFDAIHLLIIYFLVFQITGDIRIALVTQALYTLTPIIVIENSSATPRSLGYTLFTLVFMLMFAFLRLGNIWFLIAAIIFGSLIFLSHRFTTQGFLFFSLFFSVYDLNPYYLLVFLISFAIAVIFSRGLYLRVLRGHIGNLKFWYYNIRYRFYHQVRGNAKGHKNKDFVFTVYNQFLKLPPFVLSITNPWTIPLFYYVTFYYPADSLYQHLIWWSLFAYALALLTIWVPQLRFLGEGQRYLELSAFPVSFLAATLLITLLQTEYAVQAAVVYILFAFGAIVTITVIQRKAIIKETLRTLTPEMQQMFDYLKSLKKKPRLLCLPHQITTNTIYHTGCPVFVNADYTNIGKISEVYPYIRKPLKEIMRKNKLNMILLNQDYATIDELKIRKDARIIKIIRPFVLIEFK